MDAQLALDQVRRRIKLAEARLSKPIGRPATSKDFEYLRQLVDEEERLEKVIAQAPRS